MTSLPKYVVFWKGEQLAAFLAAQKLDRSSKVDVRACLIIVFRLFQLYRSFDLSNMLRVLATYDFNARGLPPGEHNTKAA